MEPNESIAFNYEVAAFGAGVPNLKEGFLARGGPGTGQLMPDPSGPEFLIGTKNHSPMTTGVDDADLAQIIENGIDLVSIKRFPSVTRFQNHGLAGHNFPNKAGSPQFYLQPLRSEGPWILRIHRLSLDVSTDCD